MISKETLSSLPVIIVLLIIAIPLECEGFLMLRDSLDSSVYFRVEEKYVARADVYSYIRPPRKLELFIKIDDGTKFKDRIFEYIRKAKNQFPRKSIDESDRNQLPFITCSIFICDDFSDSTSIVKHSVDGETYDRVSPEFTKEYVAVNNKKRYYYFHME